MSVVRHFFESGTPPQSWLSIIEPTVGRSKRFFHSLTRKSTAVTGSKFYEGYYGSPYLNSTGTTRDKFTENPDRFFGLFVLQTRQR